MERRVVVILGMDRSGTSLCTSLLHNLGMRLGPDLLPGDEWNNEGYFENQELWSIHERILALLGRSWDTLNVIRPLPPLWWRTPEITRLKSELTAWVGNSNNGQGLDLWGFKDPRTIMLLPLWDEVFEECAMRPVFVLCMRHPAAVSASLAARDRFPRLFSELLWLERNLTACQAVQARPHCIAHYERWFTDPLRQAKLLIKTTGMDAPPAAELQEILHRTVRPGLRHDQPEGQIGSAATREFYAQLRDAKTAPRPAALRPFIDALEVARDSAAVAGQLNRKELAASVFRPSYDQCTAEDMDEIYAGAFRKGPDAVDEERAQFESARSSLTTQMTASSTPPHINVDMIAGVIAPLEKSYPIPVAGDANVTVLGWAADREAGKIASAVEILIDGEPFRAEYGFPRPDVVECLGVADYLNSGFSFFLRARFLTRGRHVLSTRVVSADGSRYQQGPDLPIFVI